MSKILDQFSDEHYDATLVETESGDLYLVATSKEATDGDYVTNVYAYDESKDFDEIVENDDPALTVNNPDKDENNEHESVSRFLEDYLDASENNDSVDMDDDYADYDDEYDDYDDFDYGDGGDY